MNVTQIKLPTGGRLFAISELYGHFSALNAWLEKVRFRAACDRVILLGNFLGFAPSSRQAGAYLKMPWLIPIMGRNEADVMNRLEDNKIQNQTLIGQWLSMMSENSQAELHRALKDLPIAAEWITQDEVHVFSQAPLPKDAHWADFKREISSFEDGLACSSVFMNRLDALRCMGTFGKSPNQGVRGCGWSFSGISVETVNSAYVLCENRVLIPSSARMAQDSCYDKKCLLGSLDITAFTHHVETDVCHIDLQHALFQKKKYFSRTR